MDIKFNTDYIRSEEKIAKEIAEVVSKLLQSTKYGKVEARIEDGYLVNISSTTSKIYPYKRSKRNGEM